MADDPQATQPPTRRSTDLPADAPWLARYLEANIKEAWRWASVRWGIFVTVAAEAYAADPADVQSLLGAWIPASAWPHIVALGGLAGVLLRVVNLKGKP